MDDFALIEESTFLTLVNHYCLWETINQLNPDFRAKIKFDQARYEEMQRKFLEDYITIPIDLSAKATDKLNEFFKEHGGETDA